jgi:hypothetical protein
MRTPDVELLWWEGCPSTERALAELREALRDLGLDDVELRTREIRTDADASQARFAGSPTILLDGSDFLDLLGSGERRESEEAIGLSCRLYRLRDGRISPTPDPNDLREALRRAATRQEVNR